MWNPDFGARAAYSRRNVGLHRDHADVVREPFISGESANFRENFIEKLRSGQLDSRPDGLQKHFLRVKLVRGALDFIKAIGVEHAQIARSKAGFGGVEDGI